MQTFIDPAGTAKLSNPDHTQRHIDESDTIEAVQTVMGTTAGTSVLKNFTAGDFPARINSSNVLQQSISGTISPISSSSGTLSNVVIGTPSITGGTLTSGVIASPTVRGWDGWIDPSETWTYVSSTSFKITGVDRTSRYTVGTKLKCTNSGTKYFIVTSSSFSTDTTVNVTGGTDYTVANAAISANYYSYHSAQGFPEWFNYTPTTTPNSGTFTPNFRMAKFSASGRTARVQITTNGHALSGTVAYVDFSLPINDALETSNGYWQWSVGCYGAGQVLVSQSTNGGSYRVYATIGTATINWGTTAAGYLGLNFVYGI